MVLIPLVRLHRQSTRHTWQVALCLEPWKSSVLPGSQSDSQPQQHLWLTRLEIRAPVRRVVQPGSQEPTKVARMRYAITGSQHWSFKFCWDRVALRLVHEMVYIDRVRMAADKPSRGLRRVVVMDTRFSTETADSRCDLRLL